MRLLQDGPFSWDYTTQISVVAWGGRVGGRYKQMCHHEDTKNTKFYLIHIKSGLVF